jgi:hypothetical protein
MSFVKKVMEKKEQYQEFVNNTLNLLVIEKIKCSIEEYASSKINKYLEHFIKCDMIYDCIKIDIINDNTRLKFRIDSYSSSDIIKTEIKIIDKYHYECLDILSKLNKEEIINEIYNKVYDGCVINVSKKNNHEFLIKISLK